MTTDSWMRASDRDRDGAAALLSEAYAVGRLTREELEERAAAAYSAKTWGELRDLVADLPAPSSCPAELAAARCAPRTARPRLIGQMIWTLALVLVLVVGLAGLVIPTALWVAAVLFPFALLLPPVVGISRHYGARGERGRSAGTPRGSIRRRKPCITGGSMAIYIVKRYR